MHAIRQWLAAVAITLIAASCQPPVTPAPKAQTVSRLKNVFHAMRLLESENRSSIGDQVRRSSGGATLQGEWENLLIGNAGILGLQPEDIRDQLCRDGYGNLFNVDWRTNVAAAGGSSTLTQTDFDIVVWSSGRDGTNDWGHGDDVTLSPPPRQD
jgi:hypothetical protein